MDFSREFQSINFEFFRLEEFFRHDDGFTLKFTFFVGAVDWTGKFSVPFSDKLLESWVLSPFILGVVPSTDDLGALGQGLLLV